MAAVPFPYSSLFREIKFHSINFLFHSHCFRFTLFTLSPQPMMIGWYALHSNALFPFRWNHIYSISHRVSSRVRSNEEIKNNDPTELVSLKLCTQKL